MDNVQNCDNYISILSLQNYRFLCRMILKLIVEAANILYTVLSTSLISLFKFTLQAYNIRNAIQIHVLVHL
jgi:hypothetical protein